MDQLSVVIGEFKRWGCRSNLKAAFRDAGLLQFFDGTGVNCLNVRGNILGDEFLAFGVDFDERSRLSLLCRFFERTPFHRKHSAFSSQQKSYPIFMPASLRSMLPLPICLNIFRICAYWRRRLFTSCTVLPDPRAMRLRRLPLITSW